MEKLCSKSGKVNLLLLLLMMMMNCKKSCLYYNKMMMMMIDDDWWWWWWWWWSWSSSSSSSSSSTSSTCCWKLKVLIFIYCHLQENPDQQQFTIQSGIPTGNDIRWRSAISSRPLPKQTDFGPPSLQLDRPNCAPASPTMAFTPQFSLATTHCFSVASITRYYLLLIYLSRREEGWVGLGGW